MRMLAEGTALPSGRACSGQKGRVKSEPIVLMGSDVTAATDSVDGTSRKEVSTRP